PFTLPFSDSGCYSHCALYFSLFMLRPPPKSPLFPYTTLFRSIWCQMVTFTEISSMAVAVNLITTAFKQRAPGMKAVVMRLTATADRKSTRLNSSPQSNLVCRLLLEKKKKKKIRQLTIRTEHQI